MGEFPSLLAIIAAAVFLAIGPWWLNERFPEEEVRED